MTHSPNTPDALADELLPCPWPDCGGPAEAVVTPTALGAFQGFVECTFCGCRGPQTAHYTGGDGGGAQERARAEAITAWNTRSTVSTDRTEEYARIAERRAEERFAEYGAREPDTNATYYEGRAAEIYEALDEEDEAIAAAIRALRTQPTTPQPSRGDEGQVERVARAICVASGGRPDECVSGYSWVAGEMGKATGGSVCHRYRWQEDEPAARAAIAALSTPQSEKQP